MVRAVTIIRAPRQLPAAQIKKVQGVKDAFDLRGRFDAVALIDVKDLAGLKKTIMKIQAIKGVARTETLVEIP